MLVGKGRALVVVASLCALFSSTPAFAETLFGRVIAIADGDTLTLLDASNRQHKVRFNAIDAPERKQAFGTRSRESLADLTFQKHVMAACSKKDRYKRNVCKVYVGTTDVGLEQVRRGMAWWYEKYSNEQSLEDRARYSAAQQEAQTHGKGLWTETKVIPPWEFRRRQTRSR